MNVLAILIARSSSDRLPGKVLKPILGRPMLTRQIERLRRAAGFESLVVATSTQIDDDPIAELCREDGIECFRGSLSDVADRCCRAAAPHRPRHVLKLSGDCPLADPEIIDTLIQFHQSGNFDYSSNAVEPTYADGLDAEIFTFGCLQRIAERAELPAERQHLVPFINRFSSDFRVGSLKQSEDRSHLRWTVDEPRDFEVVRQIYEALYPGNPAFTTREIEDFLKRRPDIATLNAGIERNAGVKRDIEADAVLGQQLRSLG